MEEKNLTQGQTAAYFRGKGTFPNLTQGMISRWINQKDIIRQQATGRVRNAAARRLKEVHYPELEKALALWVESREAKGQTIKGPTILLQAECFRAKLNIPEEMLSLSIGWLNGFKERHGLTSHRRYGEAGSVDIATAVEERKRIQGLLQDFHPNNIWNFDETSFFYKAHDNFGLSSKPLPGKKLDKVRLSVLVGSNATGTQKWELLVIGKAKQPRCFAKKSAKDYGFNYHYNQKRLG